MVAVVQISASPKQLSKLRRGHPVRIKPAMNGEGFNLIVHPSRYDTITRTFSRGKGMEIALAPEEILANQQAAPTMEGSGIFGRKFDKFLEISGLTKTTALAGGKRLTRRAKSFSTRASKRNNKKFIKSKTNKRFNKSVSRLNAKRKRVKH